MAVVGGEGQQQQQQQQQEQQQQQQPGGSQGKQEQQKQQPPSIWLDAPAPGHFSGRRRPPLTSCPPVPTHDTRHGCQGLLQSHHPPAVISAAPTTRTSTGHTWPDSPRAGPLTGHHHPRPRLFATSSQNTQHLLRPRLRCNCHAAAISAAVRSLLSHLPSCRGDEKLRSCSRLLQAVRTIQP